MLGHRWECARSDGGWGSASERPLARSSRIATQATVSCGNHSRVASEESDEEGPRTSDEQPLVLVARN